MLFRSVKTYLYDPPTFRVSVTNGFTMGSNNGTYSRYNTTASQLNDDISIVVGNHQIGVGGGWIHQQLNALSMVNSTAPMTFNGTRTSGTSGVGLADFLVGLPSNISNGSPGVFYYRLNHVGGYIQDSWKVTSRLTLNPEIGRAHV